MAEQTRAAAGDDTWIAGDIAESGDFPRAALRSDRGRHERRLFVCNLRRWPRTVLICCSAKPYSDTRAVQIAV